MKLFRGRGKRILSALLVVSLTAAGLCSSLSYLFSHGELISFAEGSESISEGETSTLRFGMTWVNNSGKRREQVGANGVAYLRNKLRKEYLLGDPNDPKWGKFANSYVFCVANHERWPEPGMIAKVRRVSNYENLPPLRGDYASGTVDKYNFTWALLALYYLSKPEHTSALTDQYEDLAEYLIAKCAVSAGYETGLLRQGDFAHNVMVINSNVMTNFAEDFHPDSTGSSRIYEELAQPVQNGPAQTYSVSVLYDLYQAAEFLYDLDWDKEVGYKIKPEIEQEADGRYHAKVYFRNADINRLFWSNIKVKQLYGDWQFYGICSDTVPTEEQAYIEFTSPSGELPQEGKIAEMYFEPGTKFDDLLTDFKNGQIIQFRFEGEDGEQVGQDMLAAALSGEFEVTVTDSSVPAENEFERFEHEEEFYANYTVKLIKYDSETGEPLEGAEFDILEAFSDGQLAETSLDLEEAEGYVSMLGELIPTDWQDGDAIETNYAGSTGLNESDTVLYNRANDGGTQFERWEGFDAGGGSEICTRDHDITGPDGRLYTSSTDGAPNLSSPAHTDTKHYTYHKGYCGGHPAPAVEYEPLPEPEYDEAGNCTNEAEIAAVDEANQKLHDAAWQAWYSEVEICENLVEEGGFFHAIDEGLSEAALEADRDRFYEEFISLKYEYSAEETTARDGYILHGLHADDIPIEVRTVTSSEFKDFRESGGALTHTGENRAEKAGAASVSEREETAETAKETAAENGVSETEEDGKTNEEESETISAKAEESNIPASASPSMTLHAVKRHTNGTPASPSDAKKDAKFDAGTATASDAATTSDTATVSEAAAEKPRSGMRLGSLSLSGFLENAKNAANRILADAEEFSKSLAASLSAAVRASGGQLWESLVFRESTASKLVPLDDSILDWTFIVYDHRTEGEIHFNKQDLDLAAGISEHYNSYADANGDGTLEGAVYGLFAKSDLVHPDGKTGTVYRQNDLVAVAATDRDGNGSFLAFTEAPGRTYNYETGAAEKRTDGTWNGPENLHAPAAESAAHREDNEQFLGHDENGSRIGIKEIGGEHGTYYDRLSSNQGIAGTEAGGKTSGSYPVSDNLNQNGNYWIGRPLLLGEYYIRELSRSEGYELSVYGKTADITNKYAFSAGGDASASGNVIVSGFSVNESYDGNEFSAESAGIGESGYDIFLAGLPQEITPNVSTSRTEQIEKETKYQKPVYAEKNVMAIPGEKVLISGKYVPAEIGDEITLPNGGTRTVQAVSVPELRYTEVLPKNSFRSAAPVLSADDGLSQAEFIETVNGILEKSYKEPSKNAPWKLAALPSGGTNTDFADALSAALSDMTAFNAVRLDAIFTDESGTYAALRYSYIQNGRESDFLYDEQHDRVLVKKKLLVDGEAGFLYAPYTEADCTVFERGENGFVLRAAMKEQMPATESVSRYEDLERIGFRDVYAPSYWVYAEGETALDESGNVRTETYISGYETVTETVLAEEKKETRFPAERVFYDAEKGVWVIHAEKTDIPEDGKLQFILRYTPDAIQSGGKTWAAHTFADRFVTVSAAAGMELSASYLVSASLFYNGQEAIVSDAGSAGLPKAVYERPVRQKIRVFKNIQTNPDGSYAHDTYGGEYEDAVNRENTDVLGNFRFKAYLKSNLERLYRNEAGEVLWLDRNGNKLLPVYGITKDGKTAWYLAETDTDGGLRYYAADENGNKTGGAVGKEALGSFDTAAWKRIDQETGETLFLDFPKIGEQTADGSFRTNVPKIYTSVAHRTDSEGTGDRLNNVSAENITANARLYDFSGGYINAEQNPGYTRLLETERIQTEGGGNLKETEAYQYEKFFAALAAANQDRWDEAEPTFTSWHPIGNQANRTEEAIRNAKASDAVRQFAIDWYLEEEVKKLVKEVAASKEETEGKTGARPYSDALYDEALSKAITKADNYLKPFFLYDLDTIYAVLWDSAAGGGKDADASTLSADHLTADGKNYDAYSAYLPYGDYVISEQQPKTDALQDVKNRQYRIDQPKEVHLPAVYAAEASDDTADNYDPYYTYRYEQTPEQLAAVPDRERGNGYLIRFNEEWAHNNARDERAFVIRAHNHGGDFEVYPYGLAKQKLSGSISHAGTAYPYRGYGISQDETEPLKDYYAKEHHGKYGRDTDGDGLKEIGASFGGNGESVYHAASGGETANGKTYGGAALAARYHYGSVSEREGRSDGMQTMNGVLTAYDGRYAQMLVPWSVTAPAEAENYDAETLSGYADQRFRNTFYALRLRIEKLDGETHENLLHDGAVFTLYAAEREDSPDGNGAVKFYEEETTIYGSEEFLRAMGASGITPLKRGIFGTGTLLLGLRKAPLTGFLKQNTARGIELNGVGTLYSGVVPAGTPVCKEENQILLPDGRGSVTGTFRAFPTTAELFMKQAETNAAPNEYALQTAGYLETPQPLGAGVYVLSEAAAPAGYVRTKPIAIEIYSDKVTYYKEGNRDARVLSAVYESAPDGVSGTAGKPQDRAETARIYAENEPIKVEIAKKKEQGTVTFRIGTRIDGPLSELSGNPALEYAYDEGGTYLGYAWKKGTLEYLLSLKEAGEAVEPVYDKNVFSGYGYVTRTLDTDDDENVYAAGALMTLFDAVELSPSGDGEDRAYEGLSVVRDDMNNVQRMFVRKGYAGRKVEFTKTLSENGEELTAEYITGVDADGNQIKKSGPVWTAAYIERPDTDILFYALDDLEVTETAEIGGKPVLYGYDRMHARVNLAQLRADQKNHEKTDTEYSVYAFRGGLPYLEFAGGDLTKLSYDAGDKVLSGDFARLKRDLNGNYTFGEGTVVYHLDRNGDRDCRIDPHTGMAYAAEHAEGAGGKPEDRILVWTVNIARDAAGNVIAADKIKTYRPATVGEMQDGYAEQAVIEPDNLSGKPLSDAEKPFYEHTESGYVTGAWKSENGEESHRETTLMQNRNGQNMNEEVPLSENNGNFEKSLSPVYDAHGLVRYYQRSGESYDKGTELYDRNGEFVRYKDSDGLEAYNKDAYRLSEHAALFDGEEAKEEQAQAKLYHRFGEGYILENTWLTGDKTPNDPFRTEETAGQPDLLKRVPAGTYIMEELRAPKGYTKAEPAGLTVSELKSVQKAEVTDQTTKIYIEKIDGSSGETLPVFDMKNCQADGTPEKIGEADPEKGQYGYGQVPGAVLSLYPAKQVFTADTARFPKGYYLEQTSETPLLYETTNSRTGATELKTAQWTTGNVPVYAEGIPEGRYLLKETKTPHKDGFVTSEPAEVHITNEKEVREITMYDEHTRVEIAKKAEDHPLIGAGFTLYEALCSEDGEVLYDKDGSPRYREEAAADTWESADGTDFTENIVLKDYPNLIGKSGTSGFTAEFEAMYRDYGTKPGTSVSWFVKRTAKRTSSEDSVWTLEDGRTVVSGAEGVTFPEDMREEERAGFLTALSEAGKKTELKWAVLRSAYFVSAQQTEDGTRFPASARIVYETERGEQIVITASRNMQDTGGRAFSFSYQFDYRKLPQINDRACSYMTETGNRCFLYLPAGEKYVLSETKVPAGYAKSRDELIEVRDTAAVQYYEIINEPGALLVSKTAEQRPGAKSSAYAEPDTVNRKMTDEMKNTAGTEKAAGTKAAAKTEALSGAAGAKELAGAKLALYRADEKGGFTQADKYLVTTWVSGSDGRYTDEELANGKIPAGYAAGDLRPHRIMGLSDGIYYLWELSAPPYYTLMEEPLKIVYAQGGEIRLVRVSDVPAEGTLLIRKTDEDGGPLSGAVFELCAYEKGGRTVPVSGFPLRLAASDGYIEKTGLPVGKQRPDGSIEPYEYRLSEVTPPDGYAAGSRVVTFSFMPDREGKSYEFRESAFHEAEIENKKTEVIFEKRAFSQLCDQGTDGMFAGGAHMALYLVTGVSADGSYVYDETAPVQEFVTKADAASVLYGLIAGRTYLLKELKAPAGYSLMRPVVFTLSNDGRGIYNLSNQSNVVTVEFYEYKNNVSGSAETGDEADEAAESFSVTEEPAIASVTLRGRYVKGTETVLYDAGGKERLRFPADAEFVLSESDETGLSDGALCRLEEHTHYSDGAEEVTAVENRRLRFTDGKATIGPKRSAVRTALCLTDKDGAVIREFLPNEFILEEMIENGLNPENPQIILKNRNAEAGGCLLPGQEIFAGISYLNTSHQNCDIEVTAVLDANTELLEIYDGGEADGGTLTWTVPAVKPHTGGSVRFAAALKQPEQKSKTDTEQAAETAVGRGKRSESAEKSDAGQKGAVTVSAALFYNGLTKRSEKTVPVLQPNSLTVFYELKGSGKETAGKEAAEFEIRLYSETGEELRGSYAYTGSVSGRLRSGGRIRLFGNEFVTIDPSGLNQNVRYMVTRIGSSEAAGERQMTAEAKNGQNERKQGERNEEQKNEGENSGKSGGKNAGEVFAERRMQGVISPVHGSGAVISRTVQDNADRAVFVRGGEYFLSEMTLYSDRTERVSGTLKFLLSDKALVSGIGGYDGKTVLSVSKQDITGTAELAGNTLAVYEKESGNLIEEWVSGEAPHVIEAVLSAGVTYILRETSPADGFSYAEEIEFTLNEYGAVQSVLMTNEPTRIEIEKLSAATGKPAAGTLLEIRDINGAAVVPAWESTEEPKLITGLLKAGGQYQLVETKPAAGFVRAEPVMFTVPTDGSVLRVVMRDEHTRVRISKHALPESVSDVKPATPSAAEPDAGPESPAATPSEAASGEILSGAVLQILHEDGTEVFAVNDFGGFSAGEKLIFTTGEQFTEIGMQLTAGKTYRLHEVKPPAGYGRAEDVLFTVKEDGSLHVVRMYDEPTKLAVLKVNADGTALSGAEFELRDADGNVLETWTSGKSAHHIEGKLIAGETYYLRETKAPAGYRRISGAVPVTMNETAELLTIRIENKKDSPGPSGADYTVRWQKTDTDGAALSGAEFAAEDQYGTKLRVQEADGDFSVTVHSAQVIRIWETKAPRGYVPHERRYEIELRKDGDPLLLNGDEFFYQDRENGYRFYAVNERKTPPETTEEPMLPDASESEPPHQPETPEAPKKPEEKTGRILVRYEKERPELSEDGKPAKTGDAFPYAGLLLMAAGGFLGAACLLKKSRGAGKKRENAAKKRGRRLRKRRTAFRKVRRKIKRRNKRDERRKKLWTLLILGLFSCALSCRFTVSVFAKEEITEEKIYTSEALPAAWSAETAQAKTAGTDKAARSGGEVSGEDRYGTKLHVQETDGMHFPKEKETDGKRYRLAEVRYELLKKTKKPQAASNIKIIETEPFIDSPEKHLPEETLEADGITYYLQRCSTEETELSAREQPVTGTVLYENVQKDTPVPQTAVFSVTDSLTGEEKEVRVPLVKTEYSEETWEEEFELSVTAEACDAKRFLLGDRKIRLSEEYPLSGYESELLALAGLSEEAYRIEEIVWAGEAYEKNGTLCRDLKARGKRRAYDCTGTYGGIANLDAVRAKVIQAIYADTKAGDDAEDTDSGFIYTIKATAVYEETEGILTLLGRALLRPETLLLLFSAAVPLVLFQGRKPKRDSKRKAKYKIKTGSEAGEKRRTKDGRQEGKFR